MNAAEPAPDRIADSLRFYALLSRISERTGGCGHLATCDWRMDWPRRGVYFFFEKGERRSDPGFGLRVVRIGTHALPFRSASTWIIGAESTLPASRRSRKFSECTSVRTM